MTDKDDTCKVKCPKCGEYLYRIEKSEWHYVCIKCKDCFKWTIDKGDKIMDNLENIVKFEALQDKIITIDQNTGDDERVEYTEECIIKMDKDRIMLDTISDLINASVACGQTTDYYELIVPREIIDISRKKIMDLYRAEQEKEK